MRNEVKSIDSKGLDIGVLDSSENKKREIKSIKLYPINFHFL